MSNLRRCLFSSFAALAFACGPTSHESQTPTSSESHFLACEADSDCAELGETFRCRRGMCQPPAKPAEPAAGAGGEDRASPAPAIDAGRAAPVEGEPAAPDAAAPASAPVATCNLDTAWDGDENCLPAPAADVGVQIHVGPSAYGDPAVLDPLVLEPGAERYECWSMHTPNDTDFVYSEWEFGARPGMHHAYAKLYRVDVADGQFEACLDPDAFASGDYVGDLPGAAAVQVPRVAVAPENASIGWPVPARSPAQGRMHAFNFTDKPILREFWLNLYAPEETPDENARALRTVGGLEWVIAPQAELTARFECPIADPGRLLSLGGHILPSVRRLSAWLRRAGGERLHILEVAPYTEPWAYPYDSVSANPALTAQEGGAYSGMLALQAGDVLEWECHVFNTWPTMPLTHVGDEATGAICDLTGATVGMDIDCVLP